MASKTKGGIIVARNEMATIKLAPVDINHDQSVEEMIGDCKYNNSDINSKNFPNVNGDKLGSEDVSLILARPVIPGERYPTDEVIALFDEASFVSEDIPALSSLKAKNHTVELHAAGVHFIYAIGDNSRWQNPRGSVDVAYLRMSSSDGGFGLRDIAFDWKDEDWFVVRRKETT